MLSTPQLTNESAFIAENAWRFFPHTFAHKVSDGKFKLFPHITYMSKIIQREIVKGNARLIINVPPRHGKSWLTSFYAVAWLMEHWPEHDVIVAGHTAELSRNWGRRVKNLFKGREHLLSVRLTEDSKAAGRFNTSKGGGFLATGVGGGVLGFGGKTIILDDPHKNYIESCSARIRRKVIDWYDNDLYSRLEPNGNMIIVMQRTHPEDLCGTLLNRGYGERYTHIRLPALAEANDPMGRAEGDALCPERYTRDRLLIMRSNNEDVFDTRYGQKPVKYGSGKAYKFSQRMLDSHLDYQPDNIIFATMDFNIDPGMHIELGNYVESLGQIRVIDEIYKPALDVINAIRMLIPRLRAAITKTQAPEVRVYGDVSGRSRDTITGRTAYTIIMASLRASMPDTVFRLCLPKHAPSVIDRVITTNTRIDRNEVFIHPRCKRLVNDFKEVKTDENGHIDKSDKMLTHASDALGYMIHYVTPAYRTGIREEADYEDGNAADGMSAAPSVSSGDDVSAELVQ